MKTWQLKTIYANALPNAIRMVIVVNRFVRQRERISICEQSNNCSTKCADTYVLSIRH